MIRQPLLSLLTITLCLCSGALATAEDFAGQADLDQAIDLKLDAEGSDDLAKVAELCESAIEKGLHEEDQRFAKQLLTSVRYQRAESYAKPILERWSDSEANRKARSNALEEAEKGLKFDENVGMLHLLKGQLLLLPTRGIDEEKAVETRKQAEKSIQRAIELLDGAGKQLSEALMISLAFEKEEEKQFEILTKAIEADPNNAKAYRTRGIYYLKVKDFEKALADLKKVTEELAPGDLTSLQAYAEALAALDEFDEALSIIDRIVRTNPNSPIGYLLRARFHGMAGDIASAIEDLDNVLVLSPKSVTALLMRASFYIDQDNTKAALKDIERVLRIDTSNAQALLLRSTLFATEGKFPEAIRDLEALQTRDPSNMAIKLQLARFYQLDNRPRKAVEIYKDITKQDPANVDALRGIGDASLAFGKHKQAVVAYEDALAIEKDTEGGILNNLAWVMSTSPYKDVRSGEKALKYAEEACEVTAYSQPHIISTLASAHAENGDFEKALEWASTAVELAETNEESEVIRDHLKKELECYKKNEPWRELQKSDEGKPAETIEGPASEVEKKLDTKQSVEKKVETEPSIEDDAEQNEPSKDSSPEPGSEEPAPESESDEAVSEME